MEGNKSHAVGGRRFALRRFLRRLAVSIRSRVRRAVVLALTVAGLSLALACSSQGSQGRIVFVSDRDGNLEMYSISASGEDEVNLTNSGIDESTPVVSRNRRYVAFLSDHGGGMTVESMRIDGTERMPATQIPAEYRDIRWSPDAERIAYIREKGGETSVMMSRKDGSSPQLLTQIMGTEIGDWSKDGGSLVFTIGEGAGRGMYTVNPDGVNELKFTNQRDYSPRWSPDSKHLAFVSTRDGAPDLYIIDRNGGNLRRITDTPAEEYDISWSPNGQFLMFVCDHEGNPEIYTTPKDGSTINRLTRNTVVDEQPVWSPNGSRIAFVSYKDGDADIFVMESNGANQLRLTNNDANDTSPSW